MFEVPARNGKRTRPAGVHQSLYAFGIAALLLIAASTSAAAPGTARLTRVEGREVASAEVDIVRTLLISDLIEHPGVRLLDDDDPEAEDMEIEASITRLGENYILILSARLGTGEQRSRKHKVADFDEVDVATMRLVAALIENIDVFSSAERGAVFEDEQEPEAVVESRLRGELGFGIGWPISDSLNDHGTMYGINGAVVWDIRDVFIDLRTDFYFGNDDVDTFAFTTTIGARYVWFDSRRFGIYSGVEVGYGYVLADPPGHNPDRGAFAVGANTGILLLRHADINLDLRSRIVILTEPLQGDLPVLFGVSLGILF
ncbi:MAG: hypothetical protein ACI8W3_000225 [Myxococcota bacterium]|jgi:hypothetical protein